MGRPGDWWVLDLPGDPTPGEVAVVEDLSRSWGLFADEVERAEAGVRALAGDGAVLAWIGAAGEVFAGAIGEFPGDLAKCKESYRSGSGALARWAADLSGCQDQADRALVAGRAARADLDVARAGLSSASGAASAASAHASSVQDVASRYAGSAPVPAGVSVPDAAAVSSAVRTAQVAQSRVAAAQAAVGDAASRLDAARRLALDAQGLREDRGRVAARAIDAAAHQGISPTSFWDKLSEVAGKVWDVLVTVAKVVVAVLGIVALILGGPLAWVVFAAAVLVLADTLLKYEQGRASGWDVLFAALACIPMTKGLTTLAELRTAVEAGGALGGAVHVLAAGRAAIVEMAQTVRAAATVARDGVVNVVTVVRDFAQARALVADETGAVNFGAFFARAWKGENGLALTAQENFAVGQFADQAAKVEGETLTPAMKDIVGQIPDANLEGLQNVRKGADSLREKVAKAMLDRPDLDIDSALGTVKDAVRYTIASPDVSYVDNVTAVVQEMHARGFELLTRGWKPSWGGEGYQGINSFWQDTATGQRFELQFHTPQSFAAKTATHDLYGLARLPGVDPTVLADLEAQQNAIFSTVPTPPGVDRLAHLGG